MKVKKTKLDIPVPDGWTMSVDLAAKTVTLRGRAPDNDWYRNREVTITFHLTEDLNLLWRGATTRYQEAREYQPHKWNSEDRCWQGTGVWKRSRANQRRNAADLIFRLATGRLT